jgi:hypothetical protein
MLAALAAGTLCSRNASADFLFFKDMAPGTLEGINLVGGTDLSQVEGNTNQTIDGNPVGIVFTSESTPLLDAANGLAAITAADGQPGLTSLTQTFQAGFGATLEEFALSPDARGTITISATDQFGGTMTSEAFAVSANANQRFYVQAINGQLITSLTINSSGPLNFVRQFKVGGVAAIPAAVPEPGTLALSGLGMLGMLGLARRRFRRS